MGFWSGRKVLVTGGAGFLGKAVTDRLGKFDCEEILIPRSAEFDLREDYAVKRLYNRFRPDLVIHLAAVVGGIGANQLHPASYFYDNLMMGVHLLEHARRTGVEKFVGIGTICSYPKFTPVPFNEDSLWDGYPEETNAPYGLAKKMLLVQSQAYRQEYGYNSIHLLPVNLYGPGDNFDPETSHVIPALIRKFHRAKQKGLNTVEVWGDGTATREFLYVDDAARGISLASEYYNESDPINLGSGQEISIRDLAELIRDLMGYTGDIIFDHSKPNGQPRRQLDVTRARDRFGFKAEISFEEGLRSTIGWYLEHQ